MGQEINLMKYYPRTKRDIKQLSAEKTNEDRELARKFEKDFFDEAEIRRFWSKIIKISRMGCM